MHLRHLGAVAGVIAMLVAGCSGDDDDGANPTNSIEPVDSVSAPPPATGESHPSTTAETSSTAPQTTAVATTELSTTTLALEEQVRDAMLGYYEFYWRCLRAPSDCDPLEVAVPDSDAFRALTATRDDLIEGHYFVGAEDVGYMVITAIEPAEDHTLVTTCWWSTAWLYFQPPVDGADATVQNNTPGSSVETFQFIQTQDLSWKVRRSDGVGDEVPNENTCPPEA